VLLFSESSSNHVMCRDYPVQDVPTPLERERMVHEAFQASRAHLYIGGQQYFTRLHEHVNRSGNNPDALVVLGESGSGKSSLVCNFVQQLQQQNRRTLVIAHYIGSTAESADLGKMLRRIIEEIAEHWELDCEGLASDLMAWSSSSPSGSPRPVGSQEAWCSCSTP